MPFQEKHGFLNIKLLIACRISLFGAFEKQTRCFSVWDDLNIATRDKMNFEVVASYKSFGVIKDSLNEAKTSRWE